MQRLYRKLISLIVNGWAWALDYIYVSFWQIYGFIIRSDSGKYLLLPGENPTSKPPIILIPGIYENWRFMKPIAKLLNNNGHPVHVVSGLGYNVGEIDEMAEIVSEYIAAHRLQNSVIVAHSKGGLVGKYVMTTNPKLKLRGMVALNTPFAGSRYANFVPLKTVKMFSPNSSGLASLTANTKINEKIISIFGVFDPHIPEGSYLEGARNIQLKTRGHFRIMRNRSAHEAVLKAVKSFS